MASKYLATTMTADVLAAQAHYYARSQTIPSQSERDPLSAEETEFIAQRDSFYLASINSDSWPYVQHRGGPVGFLKVLDSRTLGFADFKGNRQLLTAGNVTGNDRVSLFLMDYPNRERLKILGHARIFDARDDASLVDRLTPAPDLRTKVERLFLIDVVSFDWNCPQYITPRFTEEQVRQAVAPLKARVAELELALAKATASAA